MLVVFGLVTPRKNSCTLSNKATSISGSCGRFYSIPISCEARTKKKGRTDCVRPRPSARKPSLRMIDVQRRSAGGRSVIGAVAAETRDHVMRAAKLPGRDSGQHRGRMVGGRHQRGST